MSKLLPNIRPLLGALLSLGPTAPAGAAPPAAAAAGLMSAQCVRSAHERLGEQLQRCQQRVSAQSASKYGQVIFARMCVFKAEFQFSVDLTRCEDLDDSLDRDSARPPEP